MMIKCKDYIDWCEFCKHDNDFGFDSVMACDCCSQKYDEKPTSFQEKASVTAYRKAISEVAE